jgi:hypothetical protein
MGACGCLDRLEFCDHLPLYDKIGEEPFLELDSVKNDGDGNLSLDLQSALLKLIRQEDFVHALQKPGAKLPVKANGAIDDDLANFVFRHFFVPP